MSLLHSGSDFFIPESRINISSLIASIDSLHGCSTKLFKCLTLPCTASIDRLLVLVGEHHLEIVLPAAVFDQLADHLIAFPLQEELVCAPREVDVARILGVLQIDEDLWDIIFNLVWEIAERSDCESSANYNAQVSFYPNSVLSLMEILW